MNRPREVGIARAQLVSLRIYGPSRFVQQPLHPLRRLSPSAPSAPPPPSPADEGTDNEFKSEKRGILRGPRTPRVHAPLRIRIRIFLMLFLRHMASSSVVARGANKSGRITFQRRGAGLSGISCFHDVPHCDAPPCARHESCTSSPVSIHRCGYLIKHLSRWRWC